MEIWGMVVRAEVKFEIDRLEFEFVCQNGNLGEIQTTVARNRQLTILR